MAHLILYRKTCIKSSFYFNNIRITVIYKGRFIQVVQDQHLVGPVKCFWRKCQITALLNCSKRLIFNYILAV